MRFLLGLPFFALLTSAIDIVHPDEDSSFELGEKVGVEWTSTDTDPRSMSLYLVNFADYPPWYEPLAVDINTDDGFHKVKIPCHADPKHGYQISAINGTNVFVVYTQSATFTVTDHDEDNHHDDEDEKDHDEDHDEDEDEDHDDDDDFDHCW